jgi:HSP20 family protein
MSLNNPLPSLFGRNGGQSSLFSALQGEIDRVFDAFSRNVGSSGALSSFTFSPSVDVTESADSVDVSAELPGCELKDVEVMVEGRILTIRGEKRTEKDEKGGEKGAEWHVAERSYGAFSRTMPLPFEADPGTIEARFEKGVLKVHVPKPPEAKSRKAKIAIKAN